MKKLDFPKLKEIQVGFGRYPQEWFDKALKQANEEGMTGYTQTKWEQRFSKLLFMGGELNLDKSLEKDYILRGTEVLQAVARSFKPKHEHKTAVCALILKNIEVDCD